MLKKLVVAGCAALALCAANGAVDPDVVAYWPFGSYGFNDVSVNGYTLTHGSKVELGDGFVSLNGRESDTVNAAMKSTKKITLSSLSALTVEFWFRWHSATPKKMGMVEISENDNNHPGAFFISPGTNLTEATEHTAAAPGNAVRRSSDNPFGENVLGWHHLVAVFPKGSYEDFRLYIDGKDDSHDDGQWYASTAAQAFHNDYLYIGGRNGSGAFEGDLAKLRFLGRKMAADEVAARYVDSYPHTSNGVSVIGSPFQPTCSAMTPAYGNSAHNLAIGEEFYFSAGEGVSDDGTRTICGWNVLTNGFVDGDYAWLPYRSGTGTEGSVPYPGVPMRVQWQWSGVGIVDVKTESAAILYGPQGLPPGEVVISLGTVSNKLHTVWRRTVRPEGDRIVLTGLDNETPHYFVNVRVFSGTTTKYDADFEFTLNGGKNVAYWPFGEFGLADATGRYLLMKGSDVVLSNGFLCINGPGTGESNPNAIVKSTTALQLSSLAGLTVDFWIRFHDEAKAAQCAMFEISENTNLHPGGFYFQPGLAKVSVAEKCSSSTHAIKHSSENPFSSSPLGWHHVSAVFPKGAYADFKLYIDGKDDSHDDTDHKSASSSQAFYDGELYVGGRGKSHDGKNTPQVGRLNGDIDGIRFVAGRRSASNMAELYASEWFARSDNVEPSLLTAGHLLIAPPEGVQHYGFYPKVGASAGHAAGETVSLKAPDVLMNGDGSTNAFVVLGAIVSTNVPGTATWLRWKKLRKSEFEIVYPAGGSVVRVDWTVGKRPGLLLFVK